MQGSKGVVRLAHMTVSVQGPPAAPSAAFDVQAFRMTLGRFATGVAVVTAKAADGALIGLTMSSFNSVSLDPPLVLFSIGRSAYSLSAMLEARSFGINLLSRAQRDLSDRFAKAQTDKWRDVAHVVSDLEAPLLDSALAHFECRPYAHYDGGDHVIFVVEVLRFSVPSEGEGPLVFFGGRYHSLQDQNQATPAWPLPLHYF
jgi:flavin reductase (DIM6/NTAB) family NADH-FMN oxidoreductase RutF